MEPYPGQYRSRMRDTAAWFTTWQRGKFNSRSTAKEVAEEHKCAGATALVTGAFSGVGLETSRALALSGCKVIMAGRSIEEGERVASEIRTEYPDAQLSVKKLDLSDLHQVSEFAQSLLDEGLTLNILINNAGVMGSPFAKSKDGYELHFATNHLGHFHLTNLLLDNMIKASSASEPGRIVNVTSTAHTLVKGDLDLRTINSEEDYNTWQAYGKSKLANILHVKQLQRNLNESGAEHVKAVSVHPGPVKTNIVRHLTSTKMRVLLKLIGPLVKAATQGAATSTLCAVAPDVEEGGYYADCALGYASPAASNATSGAALWKLSDDLVADALAKSEK